MVKTHTYKDDSQRVNVLTMDHLYQNRGAPAMFMSS